MTFLILLAGIFILGTCLAFFVSPSLVDELIQWLGRKRNLNLVVVLRLSVGLLLLVGASQTAFPVAIATLGGVFVAAGILLFFMPAERIQHISEHFLQRPTWVVRCWVLIPGLLGAFIIYAVL